MTNQNVQKRRGTKRKNNNVIISKERLYNSTD